MVVKKAVIPAAGFGTRMLPASKAVPKEMLTLVNKPVLQYIVEEVAHAGIEEVLIIVSRGKTALEDHFDYSFELDQKLRAAGKNELADEMKRIADMCHITFIRQKEPKGLGHAVYCAKPYTGDEPFAVLLGDDVIYTGSETCATGQLCQAFERCGKSVVGVQRVSMDDIHLYGSIKPEDENMNPIHVLDMIEKPKKDQAFSSFAAMGRYVLTSDVFSALEAITPGAGGELQLTDALKLLAKSGDLYACPFSGRRYDTGNVLGYLQATVEYGVRFEDDFKKYIKEYAKTL